MLKKKFKSWETERKSSCQYIDRGFQQFAFLSKCNNQFWSFNWHQKHWRNIHWRLQLTFFGDIHGGDLAMELKYWAHLLPRDINTPLEVLQYLVSKDMRSVFPNTTIACQEFLTIPTSLASTECSFSKQKLILKNYPSANMSQERLSSLELPPIENSIARQVQEDT